MGWIVFGRFITDAYSMEISGDILALIIALFLLKKYKESPLPKLVLLITLSVFYFDILSLMELRTDLSLLSAIGAVITLLISFTPTYGNAN